MKPKALHQPFELYVSDLEHWAERPLVYHFFEIVRILEGEGNREINENKYGYKRGGIFLFTPRDCRGFEAITPTRFCSIRFSEAFLAKSRNAQEKVRVAQWLKQLEHIFNHANRFRELIIDEPNDCRLITSLIDNMIQEYEAKQSYHEENLQHLVTMVLNILARNLPDAGSVGAASDSPGSEPLIDRILLHVRQHIGDLEKLRIEYLASLFNLSANYVGEYFRKNTGESLQHYITEYKLKLVRHRLANTDLTVSQIADELGFRDVSHLSRQFRKHSGTSPAEYRKKERRAAISPSLP